MFKTINRIALFLAIPALLSISAIASDHESEGMKKLFNGKNLEGWTAQWPGIWSVEDGIIVGKQDPETGGDSWLFTHEAWADFKLELEFNHTAEHNSGVGIRMPKDQEGRPSQYGFEIQISDIDEKFPTGSVFRHVAAEDGHQKEGWNKMVVEAKGEHITIHLNGEKVLDSNVEGATHKGRIGLQVHGGEQFADQVVKFRNIKIKEL